MYKSGVYSYSRIQPDNMADDDKGYHSIRIIGYVDIGEIDIYQISVLNGICLPLKKLLFYFSFND